MEIELNKRDTDGQSNCLKTIPSDDFNRIIGYIEDIVISSEFQVNIPIFFKMFVFF